MIKIGFDAKRLFKTKSGLGAYSRSLVRQILYQFPDVKIHLYTPQYEENDDTRFFSNHARVRVHVIPWPPWLWRSFLLPLIINRHKLDVFHGLSAELPFLRIRKGTKKVMTVHDVIFKSHPHYYTFFDKWLHGIKLNWSKSRADSIICVSDHTKAEFSEYYQSKQEIAVIPPILDEFHANPNLHLKESEFRSLHNLKKGYFLYVGDITGRKNVSVLLKAVSKIDPSKRKKLIFITNQDATKLLQEAEELDIYDWIRVENGISNRILSHYYAYATAVIYPSNAEGFGIPVLEAISYRVRVVCSNHPAIKEAGGDLPIYFDPDNAQQLSEILISLHTYERNREEDTLRHLNTFNPKLICDKVMNLYIGQEGK